MSAQTDRRLPAQMRCPPWKRAALHGDHAHDGSDSVRVSPHPPRGHAMKRPVGFVILGLSANGYPLTEIVLSRCGMPGAIAVEIACVGLSMRDAWLVASGIGKRLRGAPAALLYLELAVGIAASLTGLPRLRQQAVRNQSGRARPIGIERMRRLAIATLFGLHTIRFAVYLRSDQGRRVTWQSGDSRTEGAPSAASVVSGMAPFRDERQRASDPHGRDT